MNVAKAVAGAVSAAMTALAGTLTTALLDGHVSAGEAVTVVCGTVAAAALGFAGVYVAPKNTPP